MTAICSWCSAEITEGATVCPSCGANLIPDGEPNVPGVTAVDAASIIRSKTAPQPRNRLLSWISGEYASDTPSKAESQAIAPPDLEVRREILRLELEAEVANLQAETDALMAEAAAEGRTIELPEELAPADAESAAEGADGAARSQDTVEADIAADAPTSLSDGAAQGDTAASAKDQPTA